jgi:hypothetical protein
VFRASKAFREVQALQDQKVRKVFRGSKARLDPQDHKGFKE